MVYHQSFSESRFSSDSGLVFVLRYLSLSHSLSLTLSHSSLSLYQNNMPNGLGRCALLDGRLDLVVLCCWQEEAKSRREEKRREEKSFPSTIIIRRLVIPVSIVLGVVSFGVRFPTIFD